MDRDSLTIAPGLSIERLSWPEKKTLFEDNRRLGVGGIDVSFATIKSDFVIRQDVTVEPNIMWSDYGNWHSSRTALLTALRLYASGDVEIGTSWTYIREPAFMIGQQSGGRSFGRTLCSGEQMMLLIGDNTGSEVSALVKLLLDQPPDPDLAIALRRFDLAYSRMLPEDRVIDFWIGLEALFTISGERSETTDKISRRIGRLLGCDMDGRKRLIKEVKQLYSLRSNLVHGSPITADKVRKADERTGSLLRDAIRTRLADRWTAITLEDQMMQ